MILINPSHSLRAMQSVGADTSPTTTNRTWRASTRYLNYSQLSVDSPEVYKPSGSPAWLVEELETLPDRNLQVTNWSGGEEQSVYGPTREELADLIERRKTFDERPGKPKIGRWRSLKQEFKRTMSLGKRSGLRTDVEIVDEIRGEEEHEGVRRISSKKVGD
ncbi:hypothetical protein ACEQ8H_002860 [Pleosporales sp. CAS-2024a]